MRVAALADVHGNAPALDSGARGGRARGARSRRLLRRPDVGLAAAGDARARPRVSASIRAFVRGQRAIARSATDHARASRESLDAVACTHPRTWRSWRRSSRPSRSTSTASGRPASVTARRGRTRSASPSRLRWSACVSSWRIDARTVVTAHVHFSYDRKVDGIRLVGPGSVGLPYEGQADPRTGRSSARTSSFAERRTTSRRRSRSCVRRTIRSVEAIVELMLSPPSRDEVIADAEERVFAG